MAKAVVSPLVARISGALGNVCFESTRFGQVIQTKPVPKVYTTPPALLTKDRFRQGTDVAHHIYAYRQRALKLACKNPPQNLQTDLVRTTYNYLKTGIWSQHIHTVPSLHLTIKSISYSAPWFYFTTSLDTPTGQWQAWLGAIKDGKVHSGAKFNGSIALIGPPLGFGFIGLTPPCHFILIPKDPTDIEELTFGYGDAKYLA